MVAREFLNVFDRIETDSTVESFFNVNGHELPGILKQLASLLTTIENHFEQLFAVPLELIEQ